MGDLDMDFDILYSVKTPFFLGNLNQAQTEAASVEVDDSDSANTNLLEFYKLRILASQGNMEELKSSMKSMMATHPIMIKTLGELIRLIATGVRP